MLYRLKRIFTDQIWAIPLLAGLVAAVLAQILSNFSLDDTSPLARFLWPGDSASAASLLGFIASSMLTVLTTTISMTLIVLQVAAGQFSHQLLRDYIQSSAVKGILSVFSGVFVYSVVLLRSVRSESRDYPPQLGIALAIVLVFCALATFVWYVGMVVSMVRVDNILSTATNRTKNLVVKHREEWRQSMDAPDVPSSAVVLRADGSGYVRNVATRQAASWAKDNNATVVFALSAGDPVITGQVSGWVFGRGKTFDELPDLPKWVHVEAERVSESDTRLGLHQLADIALRALSPSTNDPTTAIHVINQATSLIRNIAENPMNNESVMDEGELLAFTPSPTPADFVNEIIPPIRRSAGDEPLVLIQLLRLLKVLYQGSGSNPKLRSLISGERDNIVEAAKRELPFDEDIKMVLSYANLEESVAFSRVKGPDLDEVADEDDETIKSV